MADFCKQCSIQHFNKDFQDFAGLWDEPESSQPGCMLVMCEGCGQTYINIKGECVGEQCAKHGAMSWRKNGH